MSTTRTTHPRTIKIHVTQKGTMRLVDADLLFPETAPPETGGTEPHQRRHQMSEGRTFDDGKALLHELRRLAFDRRNASRAITPEELLPFLDDLQSVLVRAGTMVAHGASGISQQARWLGEWLGSKPKAW
ncbi:MAG: hypothetical protein HQM02_09835 [Magnetococcales bacterium]|nr:hypothetical protein [Magnetococcales bacterium]